MKIQGKVSVDVNVIEIKELIQAKVWTEFVDGLSDGTAVLTARQERKVKRVSENKYKQASKTKEQAATSIEESCKAVPVTPITTKVEKVEAVSKSEAIPVFDSSEDYDNKIVGFAGVKNHGDLSNKEFFDPTNANHKKVANDVTSNYFNKEGVAPEQLTRKQADELVELIRVAICKLKGVEPYDSSFDFDNDQYDDEE